jgi:hypothetical protein
MNPMTTPSIGWLGPKATVLLICQVVDLVKYENLIWKDEILMIAESLNGCRPEITPSGF